MLSIEIRKIATALSAGIIIEPLTFIKPGNTSRAYDAHIPLREFVYGCIPITVIVEECIKNSMNLKLMFGYYIYEISKISKSLIGENVCAGTSLMIIPLAAAVGYLLAKSYVRDIYNITYVASKLVKKYSTCNDSIMLYKAIKVFNMSYVKARNLVPSLPDVYSIESEKDIVRDNIRLWDLLRYCAHVDLCSRQVVSYYEDVLEFFRYFKSMVDKVDIDIAILLTYYKILSRLGDTMILRKYGYNVFRKVRNIAGRMYNICEKDPRICIEESLRLHKEFINNHINPGSTADIVAVILSLYEVEKILNR